MALDKKYPVLRSGFITFTTNGLDKNEDASNSFALALLGKSRLAPDQAGFFHENLQKLFVAYIKAAPEFRSVSIEMQENVIVNALEAFGTKNFFDWITLQEDNPHMEPEHQRFIIETLKFILGTPRQLSVLQWVRLLEVYNEKDHSNIRSPGYYKELAELKKQFRSHLLADVFVEWMRREDGFYDFLVSMAVIFANRHSLSHRSG